MHLMIDVNEIEFRAYNDLVYLIEKYVPEDPQDGRQ